MSFLELPQFIIYKFKISLSNQWFLPVCFSYFKLLLSSSGSHELSFYFLFRIILFACSLYSPVVHWQPSEAHDGQAPTTRSTCHPTSCRCLSNECHVRKRKCPRVWLSQHSPSLPRGEIKSKPLSSQEEVPVLARAGWRLRRARLAVTQQKARTQQQLGQAAGPGARPSGRLAAPLFLLLFF